MVDVASITVAVISLVGSILTAVAGGWWAYYSEERKDRRETERLLRKYRDPLLLAAQDLQARLYNIISLCIVDSFIDAEEKYQDALFIYTAFLFGQYLCWVYILRRQTQFLCFATEERNSSKSVVDLLEKIKLVLNTDKHGPLPFMLWKGDQMAIGELMCVSEDGELMCMGFSTFTKLWKEGELLVREAAQDTGDATHSAASIDASNFRNWFRPIGDGIRDLHEARHRNRPGEDDRLRQLQHCLGDLVRALDRNGTHGGKEHDKVRPARSGCPCRDCRSAERETKDSPNGHVVLGAQRDDMA